MTDAYPITILDVVYDVLSRTADPLSPEEIAEVARGDGYDVSGWEVHTELDAHLQEFGPYSPFIEIGPVYYSLLPSPAPEGAPPPSMSVLRPLAATVVLIFILMLAFLAVRLEPPQGGSETDSNPAPPLAEPVEAAIVAGDPGWWAANGQNQILPKTFEVAQQYLRNAYNTCGPAVVAMMVSYYREHAQNEDGKLTTARVLKDARQELGFYTPPYNSGLLDFNNLHALTGLYGLVPDSRGGEGTLMSLEDLLTGLRQGKPAIAGMRYHYAAGWQYQPSGGRGLYNHFVVVFNLTQEDGKERLWVLNPHPGKYLTGNEDVVPEAMNLNRFIESWALNDGSDYSDYGHASFYQYQP